MPKVSVIVPIYNAEKFLENCVNSVRAQDFQDWELLLIDDGSKDATGALCDRCAETDSRIRVFHKENGGVSTARNLGLLKMRGEYLAFLDVDDAYEPDCLSTLMETLERAGADSAACAHLNLLPDGGAYPEPVLPEGIYGERAIREKIVYPLLGERLRQPVFNGFIWRYLYTASIVRDNGITFDGAYLEDELFLMEYFCCAKKLAVTEKPLYRYLQNPASATHKYMPDLLGVFNRFMERKEAVAEKYHLSGARPQWRENSNWAGLLIAVGNEYARGNRKSPHEKRKAVETLCAMPQFARAVSVIQPEGMTRNKQMVAKLIQGRHFFILSQMYRIKNRC